ncbi:hypothetical protein R1sor_022967 [Riccia sorocarpa]|uniref:Uncharacterized protein n=1 Tax=Riccia sorocarpa TaxID=122646 RepID=A0ABD3GN42_9MARC
MQALIRGDEDVEKASMLMAEPTVRLVAQNPVVMVNESSEASILPEDKMSKTREQFLQEQLGETITPAGPPEDTPLTELAGLVEETEKDELVAGADNGIKEKLSIPVVEDMEAVITLPDTPRTDNVKVIPEQTNVPDLMVILRNPEAVSVPTDHPEGSQRIIGEEINPGERVEVGIHYTGGVQELQPTRPGVTMYREKLSELLKGKAIAEPESVSLRALNAGFKDSLRPWDVFASSATEPTLHTNELIRGNVAAEPAELQTEHTRKLRHEIKELKEAHEGRITEAAEKNNLPTLGEFSTVQFPPAAFEQISYMRAMENRGYLEWLKLNSRPRAAEAMNSLLLEHRERWLQLTQFAQRYMDELAECQNKLNTQFSHHMELGMILQNAYELLAKADPEGKLVPEFHDRIVQGQAQLDKDQEHWFRSNWVDTTPECWPEQLARSRLRPEGFTTPRTGAVTPDPTAVGPSSREGTVAPREDAYRTEDMSPPPDRT